MSYLVRKPTPTETFPRITTKRWTWESGTRVTGHTFEARVQLGVAAEPTSCGHFRHQTLAAAQKCGEKLCRKLLKERARPLSGLPRGGAR